MKKIVFISDFFREDLLGGAESNDNNLINYLRIENDVKKYYSKNVSIQDLSSADSIVVSNFIMINRDAYNFILSEKEYIIYEHDHKYVSTRDPSMFLNFDIPEHNIKNKMFYEQAKCVVVLSEICKEVLSKNISKVDVHNIGCSLWSDETLKLLRELSQKEKNKDLCVMKSSNPTKNYDKAVQYCKLNNLEFDDIVSEQYNLFLQQMSNYKRFLFIPKVLETYSRVCAEAKMMNLDVMTVKNLIGFFSEENSSLKGCELIDSIKERNQKALAFFGGIL